MSIAPTNRTAAITGIWSSMGLVPFDAWSEHARFASVLTHNLAWLSVLAVFFFLPVIYFVIGRHTGAFSRAWFLDPAERAEYLVVVKRMLAWFLGACFAGGLLSIAMNNLSTP